MVAWFGLVVASMALARGVEAVETMVFDSTDKYIGGCQLTDKSEWNLTKDLEVTKFQMWYNWKQGEKELPITVYYEGKEFAQFIAIRSDCDPYQGQWCNADFAINKAFKAGKYSTKIANARQCLKPGGTGTIRLYSEEKSAEVTVTPVATEVPPTVAATATLAPVAGKEVVNVGSSCNCSDIAVKSMVGSAAVATVVVLVLRKLGI